MDMIAIDRSRAFHNYKKLVATTDNDDGMNCAIY